jgi:integrase
MGTVVRRNGRFRAVVRKAGLTQTKTFTKLAAARRWILETEHTIQQHADRGSPLRLGAIMDRYRREVVETRSYQTKTHFHLRRLAALTRTVFVNDLTAEWWVEFGAGLQCSPVSRQRYLTLVTSALKVAEGLWGARVDWVAYRRGKALLASRQLLGGGRPRDRRPTEAELAAIRATNVTSLPLGDIMDIALITALRAGEITRLQWSDLDRERRLLIVRDRKHPTKKTGNHGTIPLLEGALEVIERQPLASDTIFPFKTDSILTAFRRACRVAGIVNLHFHDLRHEAISRLFERGYSIQEVALVSGHRDWSSLRIYTNLRPESLHDGPIALRVREASTGG